MSATVWGKWFWADWLADPGLRACSLAARGMWMDLLCVAAINPQPGFVAIAGRAMTIEEIARLTCVDIAVANQLVAELLEKNVCGKSTLTGALFSRRIIRDSKKAAHARRIGKLGGNPNLLKQSDNNHQDNGALKQKTMTKKHKDGTRPFRRISAKTINENLSQDNTGISPRARGHHLPESRKNLTSSGESESTPPSKLNAPPQSTSGPATALPEGRAGPPSSDSEASKPPHKLTKAEFEAKLDAKRKTRKP
jgi:hypothetical protein